jgi:hypothetical protein
MTMSGRLRELRSTSGLVAALTALLVANAVGSVASIGVTIAEIGLLVRIRRGEVVFQEEALRNDDRVAAVAILTSVLFLVTGIVWLVWQHRSQSNLVAAGRVGLEYTPGWAVGWWFVPFANLVKPFQATGELWKASGGDDWRRARTWPLLGWWWATWLASNVLISVSTFRSVETASVGELITDDQIGVVGEAISVVAAILAVALVRSVGARQATLPPFAPTGGVMPPRPDLPRTGT